jgi:hypothetical protein
MRWPALAVPVLVVAAGCSGLWTDLSAAEIADGLLATPAYRGRIVERGLLPDRPDVAVVREIVYAPPGRLSIRTLEPKDRAGDRYVSDGATTTYWWPAEQTAIRVRGLPSMDEAGVRKHVAGLVEGALRDFAWSSPGKGKLLDRPITQWHATPLVNAPAYLAHDEWRDDGYGWPLKLAVTSADGSPWYSYEFTQLQMPATVTSKDFEADLPASTLVFDWDLQDPPVTLEQARAAMNFTVREMKVLPKGRTVHAHVKAHGQVPMLMSLADGDGAWLSLSQNRYTGHGAYVLPVGKAVQVGAVRGYANFAAGMTWINWVVGGTELTLAGNLAWSDLLSIAEGVK